MLKNLLLIPNLLSLFRILVAPVIGYYLWLGDWNSALVAMTLMLIAGLTDGLDGMLARKLNMVSDFGIAFDPFCDKVFAALVVIFLMLFRDFPVWLVVVIIGRDLLILIAGLVLLKGRKIVVPSNLTGKYAFTAIALLLGSATIRFEFGLEATTWLVVVLTAASLINYFRVFQKVKNGEAAPQFQDKNIYRIGRWAFNTVFGIIFTYKLYLFLWGKG